MSNSLVAPHSIRANEAQLARCSWPKERIPGLVPRQATVIEAANGSEALEAVAGKLALVVSYQPP
jgi:hypothetical protein